MSISRKDLLKLGLLAGLSLSGIGYYFYGRLDKKLAEVENTIDEINTMADSIVNQLKETRGIIDYRITPSIDNMNNSFDDYLRSSP